jgi:hypothetical protein
VVYVTDAQSPRPPPWLDAAAEGVLMAQPEVVTWGLQRLRDERTDLAPLHALWNAMTREGRLRGVLNQHDTARRAREALLHVDDLRAAAADIARHRLSS